MNELETSFARSDQILPLIHILGAICFICAHVCIIMLIRIFSDKTDITNSNFEKIKFYLSRFNLFFGSFFLIIIVSGFFLSIGNNFKFADPMINAVIVTLWVLAVFILINFGYVYFKFYSFKKALLAGDKFEASEHLIIITKYFVPLNVAVSVLCTYLCVAVGRF
ncbi:MAG: hypothetical protein J6M14_08295 [Campylobacter sp.]|nr:hypothetical protein [Campylobacter sp.]